MKEKSVLVTVGTTKFEQLTEAVLQNLETLRKLGYGKVLFQTGTGIFRRVAFPEMKLDFQAYLENFDEHIQNADLIISHAGAGTCLEVLNKGKPLIVVINENLMDNHQIELADQLQSNSHLFYCTCDKLKQTLVRDLTELKPYPKADGLLFGSYLDKCMGFANKTFL